MPAFFSVVFSSSDDAFARTKAHGQVIKARQTFFVFTVKYGNSSV